MASGRRTVRPQRGLRFDGDKVLLDPYARAVTISQTYSRAGNPVSAMKSFIADPASYDWEGDRPLQRSFLVTVIYEKHVQGRYEFMVVSAPLHLVGGYASPPNVLAIK